MEKVWADHLDFGNEGNGHFVEGDLARYTYDCDRVPGQVHSSFERFDGYGARGISGPVFVRPGTMVASYGETAEKEAADYQAGLIPPVEGNALGYLTQTTVYMGPKGAMSVGSREHIKAVQQRDALVSEIAPVVGEVAAAEAILIASV
jgi:hypothetical protein